tara:strand:+ start:707 stop:1117 length:411 start_codon:yes stop_codon:yes gene_type:complete
MAQTLTLLSHTLAAAETATVPDGAMSFALGRVETLSIQFKFVRAAGGTACKAWVQTTLDGGVTWFDILNLAAATTTLTRIATLSAGSVTTLATPTDGALGDNTAVDGFLGGLFRVKLTTTGTYSGASSLTITAMAS